MGIYLNLNALSSVWRIILWGCAMGLVACASQKLSVQHAHEVGFCKKGCQQHLKECGQVCQNNSRECSLKARCHTLENYDHYQYEQVVQGGIIARELNSFRDPLQCRKTTCNCWDDYKDCTQFCEGIIHKRLQVRPACS